MANDFFELFICSLIGIEKENIDDFNKRYDAFETKYKDKYSVVGELKSTVLRDKKFWLGLTTFRDTDIEFLNDYLDILIEFDAKIFLSCFNKISHIVRQIFKNSVFDLKTQNMWTYSITKSISNNKDEQIINSLFEPQNLKEEFKRFLTTIIEKNGDNPVKAIENDTFKVMIGRIDDFTINDFNTTWDYLPQFVGFHHYIEELKLIPEKIIIDNEINTYQAAKSIFGKIVYQEDSSICIGIRAVDILVGFIFKITSSIFKFTKNKIKIEGLEIGILDEQWFSFNQKKFNLYKKLKKTIIDLNICWYKTFADSNVDEFTMLIALLYYLDSYKDFSEFTSYSSHDHMIFFHNYSMKFLEEKMNEYFN